MDKPKRLINLNLENCLGLVRWKLIQTLYVLTSDIYLKIKITGGVSVNVFVPKDPDKFLKTWKLLKGSGSIFN